MARLTKKDLEKQIKELKEENTKLREAYEETRLAYAAARADFLRPLLNMTVGEINEKMENETLTVDEVMAITVYVMPVLKNIADFNDALITSSGDNNNEENGFEENS